ncbi:MAG: hypothetical protein HY062_03605 [Bacteroidetes bacterium]|nr:hypothetical protein [Bacteroidota bacterium]
MNDFKIIEEQVIEFSKSYHLIVMFIQDKQQLRIEITNRTKLIGKKPFYKYILGEKALDFITFKLSKMPDYISAESLCQLAFSYSTLREVLFIFNVVNAGEITKERVRRLMTIYKFDIEEEFHIAEKEDFEFERHLHVKFPFKNTSMGKFVGLYHADSFRFILNPEY